MPEMLAPEQVRIYYPEGVIWDSAKAWHSCQPCPCCGQLVEGAKPPEARGVQVILMGHEGLGWVMATGSDYYIKHPDGTWQGVDLFGLFDWLIESGLVLFGRTITNAEYQAIFQQAKADKSLPIKGGFAPKGFERVP